MENDNFQTDFQFFGQVLTNLGPPVWNPKNNRRDNFLTNLRFGAFLNAVRGRRVCNFLEVAKRTK